MWPLTALLLVKCAPQPTHTLTNLLDLPNQFQNGVFPKHKPQTQGPTVVSSEGSREVRLLSRTPRPQSWFLGIPGPELLVGGGSVKSGHLGKGQECQGLYRDSTASPLVWSKWPRADAGCE
jgi:hypothetical protein